MFSKTLGLNLKTLLKVVALMAITLPAYSRVEVSYNSQALVDFRNIYLNGGYVYESDQFYINRCNNQIAGTATPPNHRLFKTTNTPIYVQTVPDPMGRGYYVDKKMSCAVSFINDQTDCSHAGVIYSSGESRTDVDRNSIDCTIISTRFNCTNGSWGSGTLVSWTRIKYCVPR